MWLNSKIRPARSQRTKRQDAVVRACSEPLEGRRLLSFAPAVSYATGAHPVDVVTADFNSDGRLDVATSNQNDLGISVRLGTGGGALGAAIPTTLGAFPDSLAVGDFNADGKMDLAVTTGSYDYTGYPTYTSGWNRAVEVLLGNGNGTFQPPIHHSLTSELSMDVAVGDLNADGKMDLAVTTASYYYTGYPNYMAGWNRAVVVLLGNGQGGFSPGGSRKLHSLDRTSGIAIADFNADGKPDVVLANEGYNAATVLLNAGGGSLGAPIDYLTGVAPKDIAVGDFTGDGKPDVVTAGQTVDVHPGNGFGGFGVRKTLSVNGHGQLSVATGDFNGDGKLDAVTVDSGTDGAHVLLGNGTGGLQLAGAYGVDVNAVAVGDLSGDGRVDLATTSSVSNTVSVLRNDGNWAALPPGLRINDVTVVEGHSGTVNAVFTVTLDRGPAAANVTVDYSTSGYAGYQPTSGTLTFTPGQTSKTITVLVTGDRVGERAEEFYVKLRAPVNAQLFDGTGTGTITNDEAMVTIGNPRTPEGDSGTTPLHFPVTLSVPYDLTVTMKYWTSGSTARDGVDFDAVAGTLTFLPGETSKTIAVPMHGDLVDELDETVFLYMYDFDNAWLTYSSDGMAWGTIVDDDAPSFSVSDVSRAEGNAGTTAFTFTVSLSAPGAVYTGVHYATAAGSASTSGGSADYQATSGDLLFATGETSKTVTVQVIGDTRSESDETFFVNLSNAWEATIADGQGVGTILNDETRGKTWVGPVTGGRWSTAANWSPSGVPAADSFVTITGAAVTLDAAASASELSLNAGATLTIAPNGSRVFRTAALYLASDAKLNLSDNGLILDYAGGAGGAGGGAYAGVTEMIARGYHVGAWDGSGVVTTTADARAGHTTLAAAETAALLGITGSQTTLWNGQTVDATSVVVKYTYAGDANIDGTIDAGDYGVIDNFVQVAGASGYANGDFNYDGFVDAGDYGIIDNNVQAQGAPLLPLSMGDDEPLAQAPVRVSHAHSGSFGDGIVEEEDAALVESAMSATS
jgi:hypothetical protein